LLHCSHDSSAPISGSPGEVLVHATAEALSASPARLCGKHDDRLIAATTTPLTLRGPILAELVEHGSCWLRDRFLREHGKVFFWHIAAIVGPLAIHVSGPIRSIGVRQGDPATATRT
jgi:hypothetical protein